MSEPTLQNWIPIKLLMEKEQAYCEWLPTGAHEFLEPFFEETLSKCKGAVYPSRKSVSSVSMLPEWCGQVQSIAPTAFIFHVSRCGSTLVSQMLSLNPSHIVLSEVPFFDQLLQLGGAEKEKADWLKAAICFYGAKKRPSQNQLFIKTDSWHILYYQQLRALFPEVPFILLYRHPAEVIRSQEKRRGLHSVPGLLPPAIFGWTSEQTAGLSLNEYLAGVLEKYFRAFLKVAETDASALLINYKEGPLPIVNSIADHIGFTIGEAEQRQMRERARFHSKNASEVFSEHTDEVQLPPYCGVLADLYEQLEAIRCGKTAPACI